MTPDPGSITEPVTTSEVQPMLPGSFWSPQLGHSLTRHHPQPQAPFTFLLAPLCLQDATPQNPLSLPLCLPLRKSSALQGSCVLPLEGNRAWGFLQPATCARLLVGTCNAGLHHRHSAGLPLYFHMGPVSSGASLTFYEVKTGDRFLMGFPWDAEVRKRPWLNYTVRKAQHLT